MSTSPEEKELILIVDDEPLNLRVLGSFLKQKGYATAVAQNGQQALDFVEKKLPDIILLDVMMPEMDGFETARRLKKNDRASHIPILFITALTDTASILKGFESGGSDYVNKPIVQEEVLARIQVQLDNRRLIKALSQANKDLQTLDRTKNEFLGIAAHDLRNPLGSILGFTDLIMEGDFGDVSEEQVQILERISKAGQRMLNLVNNLLDISVIESGKLTLNMTSGKLKQVLEERVPLSELLAAKKGISLELLCQTNEASEFDEEKMVQVIDNLLGNAIKFSPKDSHIKVGLERKNDRMEIWVQDTGPGISEADQQKLFGKFQQLSAKATAGEKGTGLGLAIGHKIVTAHRGSITVDSELGSGTTFTVSLPITSEIRSAE